MKWRCSGLIVSFLLAASIRAQPSQKAAAVGNGYPNHVQATLKAVRDAAYKNAYPKDGFISDVEVQGGPGYSWLQVDLYSPSTGVTVRAYAGGPGNGQYSVGYSKPHDPSQRALPTDFKIDFADAMATLGKVGLHGALGVTRLEWAGAHGAPEFLAWSIRVAGGPVMFPLFIDAQTGKLIPWRRAMDPPNGSDAQLRAIWGPILNPPRPESGGGFDIMECMEEIKITGACVMP